MGVPHNTWTSQPSPVLHVLARVSDDPAAPARLLTIKQIAGACQLSEKAVRRAIDHGELTAIKLRSRLRVTPHDFDAWIKSSRQTGGHVQVAPLRHVRRPAPSVTFRTLVETNAQTVTER